MSELAVTELLEPWRPTPFDPFDMEKASHLLRRAAFGSSLRERRRASRRGVERAVAELFEPGAGEDVDRFGDTAEAFGDIDKLRAYRLWRMLAGRERLKERMSYFWHGHFATSFEKVRDVGMIAGQWRALDAFGLGSFDTLLLEMSRDPAMIRWLDNDTNVKGRPNENYAREIFELFALGRGNYTEIDIQAAARAFTGWHVRDRRFWLSRRRHDGGEKTLFGRTGRFGGEDVVALTAAHPSSARFIARKLLAFFVHPEPSDAEVDALAQCYTANERNLGDTMRVLLRSRLFFSSRAVRSRIKDPIDLVVGLVRSVGATASPQRLTEAAGRMGQVLCSPPSVEGWHRERAWITSATWLLRTNFAAELFAGRAYGLTPPSHELLDATDDPGARLERAALALCDGALSERSRAALEGFAGTDAARGPRAASATLHAVQSLPEAQLL